MAAYVVANITETDPEGFRAYREAALPVVAAFGGRTLIEPRPAATLESGHKNAWTPERLVIVRFPDLEMVMRWHASQEYAGPKAMRQAAARTDMLLYQGRDP
jgi:uncharacterized protein (DUF1330 family)